jgi:hypothetical protein
MNLSIALHEWLTNARNGDTQVEAERQWCALAPHLSVDDRTQLKLAWSHFLLGEGREELDRTCRIIITRIGLL